MSEPMNGQPALNLRLFLPNRDKFPAEELAKYAGKHVAFSGDGLRILASGDTIDDVVNELAAAGLDVSQTALEYVAPPDMILL